MKISTIALVVLVAVVALVGYAVWSNTGTPESSENAELNNTQVNFTKSGNIVKDNPGLKPGVWYLIYEEPGKPALSVELAFDSNTQFIVDGKQMPYADSEIVEGGRVSVEGFEQNGVVKVIKFTAEKAPVTEFVTIKLFYYNEKQDKTQGCDTNAVLPVERRILVSKTPIQDTVNLLIKGDLQDGEKLAGFSTEFPNKDFRLLGADLKNGVLALEFSEVPGFTTGGSCRVGLLTSQITKTVKQFSEVKQVIFKPDSIFQP